MPSERVASRPSLCRRWSRRRSVPSTARDEISWRRSGPRKGCASLRSGPQASVPGAASLEQAELLAGQGGGREPIGPQLDRALVQPEPLGGNLESAPDYPGVSAFAHYALAPFGIVELAAARRAHKRQHAVGAVGAVRLE